MANDRTPPADPPDAGGGPGAFLADVPRWIPIALAVVATIVLINVLGGWFWFVAPPAAVAVAQWRARVPQLQAPVALLLGALACFALWVVLAELGGIDQCGESGGAGTEGSADGLARTIVGAGAVLAWASVLGAGYALTQICWSRRSLAAATLAVGLLFAGMLSISALLWNVCGLGF